MIWWSMSGRWGPRNRSRKQVEEKDGGMLRVLPKEREEEEFVKVKSRWAACCNARQTFHSEVDGTVAYLFD